MQTVSFYTDVVILFFLFFVLFENPKTLRRSINPPGFFIFYHERSTDFEEKIVCEQARKQLKLFLQLIISCQQIFFQCNSSAGVTIHEVCNGREFKSLPCCIKLEKLAKPITGLALCGSCTTKALSLFLCFFVSLFLSLFLSFFPCYYIFLF